MIVHGLLDSGCYCFGYCFGVLDMPSCQNKQNSMGNQSEQMVCLPYTALVDCILCFPVCVACDKVLFHNNFWSFARSLRYFFCQLMMSKYTSISSSEENDRQQLRKHFCGNRYSTKFDLFSKIKMNVRSSAFSASTSAPAFIQWNPMRCKSGEVLSHRKNLAIITWRGMAPFRWLHWATNITDECGRTT